MQKLFPPDQFAHLPPRSWEELIAMLRAEGNPLGRTVAAIQLAGHMSTRYDECAALLLAEMTNPIQFEVASLTPFPALTIAVLLAENLRPADYPQLQAAFDQWEAFHQEYLFKDLEKSPDHLRILTGGHREVD